MKCYLCECTDFILREGRVRDDPSVPILQCSGCGLVTVGCGKDEDYYQSSSMRKGDVSSVDGWLRESVVDDERRLNTHKALLAGKRILDFGCGAGGFLDKARLYAAEASGVELDDAVRGYWGNRLNIASNLSAFKDESFDVIFAFHVLEHSRDPISLLKCLERKLATHGRLILEVPNSEDALITLYQSKAYQNFIYWSPHIYIFNEGTLTGVAQKAGFEVLAVSQFQRYSISNHLYWLSNGRPGGHVKWGFLDLPELSSAYASSLASLGKADTLVGHFYKKS